MSIDLKSRFLSLAAPCTSNPCLNDGECVNIDNDQSYRCLCTPAFMGDNCEEGMYLIFHILFSLQLKYSVKLIES